MLLVLNSDSKLEIFSVLLDQQIVLKKLVKQEKRQNLKRSKQTTDKTRQTVEQDGEEGKETNDELPVEVKVDKALIK